MTALNPEIVDDDAGDVAHARLALFDEGDFEGATLRYWATAQAVVIQSLQSSETTRGRDMLRWLGQQSSLPIRVVEAIPAAGGFWSKMEEEGLISHWEEATGSPSRYEQMSRPWPALKPTMPSSRRRHRP